MLNATSSLFQVLSERKSEANSLILAHKSCRSHYCRLKRSDTVQCDLNFYWSLFSNIFYSGVQIALQLEIETLKSCSQLFSYFVLMILTAESQR